MSSIVRFTTARAWLRRHALLLILLPGLLLAGLAVPGESAVAGVKRSAVVTVDTAARKATGGMASTRAYSVFLDRDSYIGCWSSHDLVTNTYKAGCDAKRGSTEIKCTVNDQIEAYDFIWAVGLIGPNSYIEFTWDANKLCHTLKVYDDSRYAPKAL